MFVHFSLRSFVSSKRSSKRRFLRNARRVKEINPVGAAGWIHPESRTSFLARLSVCTVISERALSRRSGNISYEDTRVVQPMMGTGFYAGIARVRTSRRTVFADSARRGVMRRG